MVPPRHRDWARTAVVGGSSASRVANSTSASMALAALSAMAIWSRNSLPWPGSGPTSARVGSAGLGAQVGQRGERHQAPRRSGLIGLAELSWRRLRGRRDDRIEHERRRATWLPPSVQVEGQPRRRSGAVSVGLAATGKKPRRSVDRERRDTFDPGVVRRVFDLDGPFGHPVPLKGVAPRAARVPELVAASSASGLPTRSAPRPCPASGAAPR